eukprot:779641-Prymnesium_polylepis.1
MPPMLPAYAMGRTGGCGTAVNCLATSWAQRRRCERPSRQGAWGAARQRPRQGLCNLLPSVGGSRGGARDQLAVGLNLIARILDLVRADDHLEAVALEEGGGHVGPKR